MTWSLQYRPAHYAPVCVMISTGTEKCTFRPSFFKKMYKNGILPTPPSPSPAYARTNPNQPSSFSLLSTRCGPGRQVLRRTFTSTYAAKATYQRGFLVTKRLHDVLASLQLDRFARRRDRIFELPIVGLLVNIVRPLQRFRGHGKHCKHCLFFKIIGVLAAYAGASFSIVRSRISSFAGGPAWVLFLSPEFFRYVEIESKRCVDCDFASKIVDRD